MSAQRQNCHERTRMEYLIKLAAGCPNLLLRIQNAWAGGSHAEHIVALRRWLRRDTTNYGPGPGPSYAECGEHAIISARRQMIVAVYNFTESSSDVYPGDDYRIYKICEAYERSEAAWQQAANIRPIEISPVVREEVARMRKAIELAQHG